MIKLFLFIKYVFLKSYGDILRNVTILILFKKKQLPKVTFNNVTIGNFRKKKKKLKHFTPNQNTAKMHSVRENEKPKGGK
jgi:hypothetical protein